MEDGAIIIDDQPISATFFNEGRWLTEFITPGALEVKNLHEQITKNISSLENRIRALQQWVATQVKYKQFIAGRIWVEGQTASQRDFWMNPSMTILTRIGNCANKSFLLTSLLRNELSPSDVHCVLGNLNNGEPGGHSWVQFQLGDRTYISETTRPDVPPMVLAALATRYEAVHLFNDKDAYAIEGRTVMEPFANFYSTWLKDYLDFAYIEGRK